MDELNENTEDTMDESYEDINDIVDNFDESTSSYKYPIIDQFNNEITNPDLTLGYLKKEDFTVHHESIPEDWHYVVDLVEFANGEIYHVEGEGDPHIEAINAQAGIFKFKFLEGEVEQQVVGQTITPVITQDFVEPWNETKTFYRYILYTEKELAEREFLANGPVQLAEAQETIDDLLLVIADLLGGAEE